MLKINPSVIKYKLPFSKKVIEVPKNCIRKSHVIACASTLEAFGGLGFLAAGIAQKEPIFVGTALAIFGKIAGQIAMLKGSVWDFAGKFKQKEVEKILQRTFQLKKTNPDFKNNPKLLKELENFEKQLTKS